MAQIPLEGRTVRVYRILAAQDAGNFMSSGT